MKIKDIQIDGFGVWTGLSVDSLPDGMTLFYGPNEAGKTTLMQFVRAMLYGFTPDRREKYLPPIYGGTPGGAMRVTGPGGGYEIRRHSQLTDSNVTGRLSVTGQDGLAQGQHRLTGLLGQIDEPIFTNVFAIGMRELQELSTLDDTSAADELYKLSSGLDRVSLVDVLRSLRGGRKAMVGKASAIDEVEADKLASLISKREKLRDEVANLTRGGRRWSELASQRRSGQQEIEQLTERIGVWEREARTVETATGVFEAWRERETIAKTIAKRESEVTLPDEAPGQLVQIDAMMEERRQKIEEIKNKRRAIREKASQLPVSKRMVDLEGRIQAASEQATWVEALEEQILRLDDQIEKARKQLDSDAESLGIDEDDREALAQGDVSQLPDMSRQTLSALSGPARQVKEQTFLLKQARTEGADHKARADKMGESLRSILDRAHSSNLQQAIREQTQLIATLKHRIQVGEHLEKIKRHYRELEKESVELTTSEALPVDRLILLAVPFIVGGMGLIYGFAHVFNVYWLVSEPDPTWGMLYLLFGIMSLLTYYFGRENGQRSTSLDLEDCERQIDTLRKQIREIEAERSDIDNSLPTNGESLELRLRESEAMLSELESSLPTYHNHEAALQAYKATRKRAEEAAQGLRHAKRDWSATLERLGLSESMSPASVRKLGDGYQTLQASRRRLDELLDEREQRRRERQTIAKRIETLYLEALDVNEEAASSLRANDDDDFDDAHEARVENRNENRRDNRNEKRGDRRDDRQQDRRDDRRDDRRTESVSPYSRHRALTGPLEQLHHLHEELSRQQHWIKKRRDLKEQDLQLKRQQSNHHRQLERCEQQRRGLWAKCGVATPEQFYAMVDTKATLSELNKQHEELEKQIRSIIGTHVDPEDVAREIEGATATDLERRWESLTTRISETEARIAELRTLAGQLSQEMKQLGDDNRLTVAQLELGCIERKIESTARRWQTLGMASCLLEDVCKTFERERQPETLREASSFLAQLTDGKYNRIWTPLGTNQLKIDEPSGKSLALEVLSRGTREAVFIALRLSLAAAYARRGVMLPLVLDDVLVNFDRDRAIHAARTLKTFAELGHQVMMFTCHEHIVDIFHDIDVEVRLMPAQGEPGRATVMIPEETHEYEEYEEEYDDEVEYEEEEVLELEPEPEPEPEPVVAEKAPEPETKIVYIERPEPKPEPKPQPKPEPKKKPRPKVEYVEYEEPKPVYVEPERILEPEYIEEREPAIGWAWFEREPGRRFEEAEEALAAITSDEWIGDHGPEIPDDVWNGERREPAERNPSWWS
ncbi:AAA family ATPase [Rubripirellula amarantea]|nr:AAA family ATPase [Rubripirellula amarantea]